jgi:PAS domain S-box-containing protein
MKTRTNNKIMTLLSSNSVNASIKLVKNKTAVNSSKRKQVGLNNMQEANEQLLNSAPVAIFIHENGVCKYCNFEAIKILEEENSNDVIGKYLIDYFIPEQKAIAIDRIKKTINGEVFESMTYTFISGKNTFVEVDIKSNPVIYNSKQCVCSVLTSVSVEKKLEKEILRAKIAEEANKKLVEEIIYRQKIQDELSKQTTKYEAIFNNTSHLIWTIDKNLKITSFNQNYKNYVKTVFNHNLKIGQHFDLDLKLESSKLWSRKLIPFFKNKEKNKAEFFEVKNTTLDGKVFYIELYLQPIKSINGNVSEISIIAQNTTQRRLFEEKIIEQSAKLKAIFESGDQLMWTITKDLKITSFNQNYATAIFDLYGYFPEIGMSIRSDKSKSSHDFWDEKYKLAFEGSKVEFISERQKADGEKVVRQMILYPIKDKNSNTTEVSGIGFNITENKKNEEKLTQSLREKEVLLKEVHHRVKNNMQVISSILNIQSSYVKDVYALNLLSECQNRIKSMAFIHESLYQSENFESINFSEYVSSLTKNLVHTYSINSQKIKLILTLDKLILNLDLSIPCGLIINEIISNSLKYAFPNNRDGIIFVTLSAKQKKVTIEVGDNGIGLPKSIDIKNSETLGLQLIETLVDQINGKVKLSRNKGTVFKINFNI